MIHKFLIPDDTHTIHVPGYLVFRLNQSATVHLSKAEPYAVALCGAYRGTRVEVNTSITQCKTCARCRKLANQKELLQAIVERGSYGTSRISRNAKDLIDQGLVTSERLELMGSSVGYALHPTEAGFVESRK
jgi:hypothetical protein